MIRLKPLTLALALCLLSVLANAQRMTKEEYIEKYKGIAIEQMKKNGVPASIIMAQALIESANGNGTLAKEANNHFGIKCHKGWTGPTVHHDDDAPNECFRKYDDVRLSYEDHSKYLLSNKRYAFLFELPTNDYKSWAYGLKKAGYATNPRYSEILIKQIEDNQLYLLDQGVDITFANRPATTYKKKSKSRGSADDGFVVDIYNKRSTSDCNGVKFVVAKDGDSVDKLSEQYGLMRWQLYKYNELSEDSVIRTGQRIYIQPKRNSASKGNEFYTASEGDTMYQIAQNFGMKLSVLYKKNEMKRGDEPTAGQKIYLRSYKSGKNWLQRLFSGS